MGSGALVVELEEPGEDFFTGERVGPAVGGEDSAVKGFVGVGEPGGTLIIEVGEGAVFQLGGIDVGRVEPDVAQADEFAGGVGDSLDESIVGFSGLVAGGPREGVSIKCGIWRVSWSAL